MIRAALLLDDVLPVFDARSRHNRLIHAPAEAVWRAVERYDPRRDASIPVRALFRLRGLSVPRGSIREVLRGSGFGVLAERPGEEVVAGTVGRFWALRERANMEAPASLEAFTAFDRPGWAKAAICIRVEPRDQGWSMLVTETRVRCVDQEARRRFAAYWALIGPFSGWIRRDVLGAMATMAEGER